MKPEDFLPKGTTLEKRFEIDGVLGAGSFGAVYRARQLVFGKPMRAVALKLFHAEAVRSDNMEDIFSDAVTLVRLHEEDPPPEIARSIIQVYDIGVVVAPQPKDFKSTKPQGFMSMNLVRGGKTLKTAIARFRHDGMPVSLALQYLRQLLVPLAWMHTLETAAVHGDLKPDNILLTDQSELILTDFGLAAHLPLGTIGGEIHYQAQETLSNLPGMAQSDVFGVGLIWYEMLTGKHPFHDVDTEVLAAGGNQAALIRAHVEARKWPFRPARDARPELDTHRIVPPSEINAEMLGHPQLELLLASCLAYRQSDRPADARILLDKIDRYIREGHIPGLTVPEPATAPGGEKAVILGKKTPEAVLKDAEAVSTAGDRAGALRLIETVLKDHPTLVPALLAKVRVLAANKQIDQAREVLAKAQKINPQDPCVFEALADIYAAAGQTDLAQRTRQRTGEMRKQKR